MYDSLDFGLIDFSVLPKRLVASQIARAACNTSNYELARRTLYRLMHLGAFIPPQLEQGGKLTWDRDILKAHVNLDVVKNSRGEWVWFETGKPIPVCPGFVAQKETSYRPAQNSAAAA